MAFFSIWTYAMSYKFSESLKKNYDFQQVYRKGKSYANKYLVMYVLENNMDKNRLGISVSKKVGNSVVRHRITRLIRESYRLHENIWFRYSSHSQEECFGHFLQRGRKCFITSCKICVSA